MSAKTGREAGLSLDPVLDLDLTLAATEEGEVAEIRTQFTLNRIGGPDLHLEEDTKAEEAVEEGEADQDLVREVAAVVTESAKEKTARLDS